MNEQWQELKETITELRDNDGTGTQQEICEFLANLMEVLEKQMKESKTESEEQPCEDCISREAVINVLKELMSDWDNDYNVPLIKTRGRVKDLPSVTPTAKYGKALKQTRWIPCSERLPEAFEFVNCTCHSLIDDREDWVIETVYIPQPSDSPYSDWGNIPMLNSGDCKVFAWMHRDIPEPYKAESEEV